MNNLYSHSLYSHGLYSHGLYSYGLLAAAEPNNDNSKPEHSAATCQTRKKVFFDDIGPKAGRARTDTHDQNNTATRHIFHRRSIDWRTRLGSSRALWACNCLYSYGLYSYGALGMQLPI